MHLLLQYISLCRWDAALLLSGKDLTDVISVINFDLFGLSTCKKNGLELNISKSGYMIFRARQKINTTCCYVQQLPSLQERYYNLSQNYPWSTPNVQTLNQKCMWHYPQINLCIFCMIRYIVPDHILRLLYYSLC